MKRKNRTIVVGVISDCDGKILLCKMPSNRGVFPGKWGLAGGGIKEDETMLDALHREIKEEVGISIKNIKAHSFSDDVREKLLADGSKTLVYMIEPFAKLIL